MSVEHRYKNGGTYTNCMRDRYGKSTNKYFLEPNQIMEQEGSWSTRACCTSYTYMSYTSKVCGVRSRMTRDEDSGFNG